VARRKIPVFINCPFDGDYLPFFHATIFTVYRCGFTPRCALEVIDGGGTRIAKIEKLIEECPFGIHDISRTELDATNRLPRFNMPLELGLFLGARRYGDAVQKRKRCLVLDREPYRYQKFISDIAGQDTDSHDGQIDKLIEKVRAFLNSSLRGQPLLSAAAIRTDYEQFDLALPVICQRLNVDPDNLDYRDFAWIAADYVSKDERG
jgi:hypothetical protein